MVRAPTEVRTRGATRGAWARTSPGRWRVAPVAAALAVAAVLSAASGGSSATVYDSRDAALRREVGKVMADPRVTASTARVGMVVADASTRRPVYLRGADTPLAPASTQKAFTAAAALTRLGPGFRWTTDAYAAPVGAGGVVPGRLYLKGSGDPTLLERDLSSLVAGLRAKGVKRITGDVVADASAFDEVRYNPYWSTSYASSYYAGQVSALTLSPDTDYDAGTVIVTASPGTSTSALPRITVTPASAASHLRIVNRSRTSASGTATTIAVSRAGGTNTVTVTGQVPVRHTAARKWVTVDNPALMVGRALRSRLVAAGIRVDGTAVRGTTPSGRTLLARHYSMTLGQLMVPFLKLSNNSHAEAITKTLGHRTGRPGSWADGTSALRAYAAGIGIPTSGLRFVDGSGLARANRLTPGQLALLLDKAQRASWWPTFRAALPVAGVDPVRWQGGTLASRMRATPAAGNLRAKNGSLTGVTSLAGYVNGADGRRYVFVMMSSFSGTSPRPVEDRLGMLLARWRMTNR
ncbi:D-alanyl-D-alanine carboxypeptidase/D-alanyl-D-alanine-endopeptidase [Terrabacter sp. BE26]|uniref:D-alanyl-D-alanine carboxypeptidase/D-alanyl-D-alanine endopeptidase n=1 Tax=Terrabacter sp. BE26 TaxID=2898152 RepID=UPI0035BE336C